MSAPRSFLVLACLVAACSGSAAPTAPDPSLFASWTGASNGYAMTLLCGPARDRVAICDGTLTDSTGAHDMRATGAYDEHGAHLIRLGISSWDFWYDYVYEGVVKRDRIVGALSGNGLVQLPLTLTRDGAAP